MFDIRLQENLLKRANHFLLRTQDDVEATKGSHLFLDGKKYLSFSSNDYLGLSQNKAVIRACQSTTEQHGVGSGSAYLVAGYTSVHKELEEELADFLQYPRVLLFSCGYLANIGVLSTLFSKNDHIFADKLNHASLLDGCLISKAKLKRYAHCKVAALEKLCHNATSNKVIVTEGLFGMDGTLAPLDKIDTIASSNKAITVVDDAHGIGVLGRHGRGTLEHYQLGSQNIPILVGTLGKAFGSYGAFVASSSTIIDSLIQTARTYLYTTAIPPAIAAASLASLRIIRNEPWRREKLQELIAYFKKRARETGLPCCHLNTPIQPIIVGSNQKSLEISSMLLSKGIFIKAIRPPTVPQATARLRITITALHTKQQLDFLIEGLSDAINNA